MSNEYRLSEDEQRALDEATRITDAALADAATRPPLPPGSDKFTGPVFVDKNGDVQRPTPELTAKHRAWLKLADEYAEQQKREAKG